MRLKEFRVVIALSKKNKRIAGKNSHQDTDGECTKDQKNCGSKAY